MNLKDYIESGIIESYVMGLASESERAEFERLCAQYPELVAARRKFEEGIEASAKEQALPTPPEVKVKIFEAIGKTAPSSRSGPSSIPPKIHNMENAKSPARGMGMLRFVAAAAVILLIAMVWLYMQAKQQNQDLVKENDGLKTQRDTAQNILNRIVDEQKHAIGDPNTTVVNMVGTKVAPKSSANVYWDSASSSVYLVVKNMPKLPNDQQYQLWALIDGKPNDLGVFDATNEKLILKMKDTKRAQAFAITIEKHGGSPSPTLEKMQSMGKATQTQ
ncbi:anti-sigma factor [Puia sp. P3]|uniref:anti-sigma factor n=1 Tax=Puia sp. P3 TaxID=3423952 RepID=UPI003D666707